MNKPTVISTGEWLPPAAVWDLPDHKEQPFREALASERKANVVCSRDQGQTWQLRGGAIVPERSHDEHMIVEKKDGTLWMLVRNKPGIAESFPMIEVGPGSKASSPSWKDRVPDFSFAVFNQESSCWLTTTNSQAEPTLQPPYPLMMARAGTGFCFWMSGKIYPILTEFKVKTERFT